MIEVELPDGSIAEFPDGTAPDVIKSALSKRFSSPAPQMAQSELEGGGIGGRAMDAARGFARGAMDIPEGGAQLAARGVESATKRGVGLANKLLPIEDLKARGYARDPQEAAALAIQERQKIEAQNAANEQTYKQDWMGGRDPSFGKVGRVLGNVAASAPIAYAMPGAQAATIPGRMASGALSGAATGALSPTDGEDFWSDKAKQVGMGGLFGGVAPAVVGGVSRMFAPKTRPDVSALMSEGVKPTPGQIMGGAAQRIEEGAASIPFVGNMVRSAQRRSVEQFNRATINRALRPIGETLDDATPLGREAVEEAGQKISQAYDELLPKLTARVDDTFTGEISALRDNAQYLGGGKSADFEKILNGKLKPAINEPTGTMTGEALKKVESELGSLSRGYKRSPDPDQRGLGDALGEAQAALRRLVERSNPEEAGTLKAINRSYAELLRVENAAGRAGSKEGVFSPAALRGAVKQLDSSMRKRQFSRGNALGQDFAESAENVLGPKVPDSGSPERLATMLGLLTGGTAYVNPYAGAAAGGIAGMYSKPGQWLAAQLLAGKRPEAVQAVGRLFGNLTPAAAVAAPQVPSLFRN